MHRNSLPRVPSLARLSLPASIGRQELVSRYHYHRAFIARQRKRSPVLTALPGWSSDISVTSPLKPVSTRYSTISMDPATAPPPPTLPPLATSHSTTHSQLSSHSNPSSPSAMGVAVQGKKGKKNKANRKKNQADAAIGAKVSPQGGGQGQPAKQTRKQKQKQKQQQQQHYQNQSHASQWQAGPGSAPPHYGIPGLGYPSTHQQGSIEPTPSPGHHYPQPPHMHMAHAYQGPPGDGWQTGFAPQGMHPAFPPQHMFPIPHHTQGSFFPGLPLPLQQLHPVHHEAHHPHPLTLQPTHPLPNKPPPSSLPHQEDGLTTADAGSSEYTPQNIPGLTLIHPDPRDPSLPKLIPVTKKKKSKKQKAKEQAAAAAQPSSVKLPPSASSGGIPNPSPSYILQSSGSPSLLPAPRPILVVIDLNGTLLFRPSRRSNPRAFIERPHAKAFLSYCINTFSVMIWSSARPDNVASMCDRLIDPQNRPNVVAIWGRDRFGLSKSDYNERVQCYKRLSKVWEDDKISRSHPAYGSGGRWDQTNTLLIDDSREKARSEPFNLIEIPEFTNAAAATKDDVLPQVHTYLNLMTAQADVSRYIRLNPFKPSDNFELN